jgi:hypothetical protein
MPAGGCCKSILLDSSCYWNWSILGSGIGLRVSTIDILQDRTSERAADDPPIQPPASDGIHRFPWRRLLPLLQAERGRKTSALA